MKPPRWGTVVVVITLAVFAAGVAVAIRTGRAPAPQELAAEARPADIDEPMPIDKGAAPSSIPRLGLEPIPDLRSRRLLLPVKDIQRDALRDSFDEARWGRRHEAIDILAPRNTPVVAVEDGLIAKLFYSKAGGNTIYQFDPTATYAYYYAHLERYGDGLHDGSPVRRGEVIGYVGTSGNAPPETPHLHFAIFKLTEKKQWWKGAPINPYDVLK